MVSPKGIGNGIGGETVGKRRRHGAELKARVVIEAVKGEKTINELASLYQVHPKQIGAWKRKALEALPSVFSDGRERDRKKEEALKARLYEQIGQLKVELDWLKKKLGMHQ